MLYSIFDVDGTILDSMKIWDVLASRYIRSLHKQPAEDLDSVVAAMSMEQSAHYLKQTYQISESEEKIQEDIVHILQDFYVKEVQLKPGFREFITRFDSRNLIATSSDRELIEKAFQRLGISQYFEKIVTCSQIGKSKNEPDIYLACAEYFQKKPEEICVFEDAWHCVQTAKEAGFHVIGIKDESNTKSIASLCDVYIEDWRQIGGTTLGRFTK